MKHLSHGIFDMFDKKLQWKGKEESRQNFKEKWPSKDEALKIKNKAKKMCGSSNK